MLLRRKKRQPEETTVEQVAEIPEVEEETLEPVELTTEEIEENPKVAVATEIPLTVNSVDVVWNLNVDAIGDFTAVEVESHKEPYRAIAKHVTAFTDEVSLYGFDLGYNLVNEDTPAPSLALTEHEAWDLSLALVQEIADRKENGYTKRFIVFISDYNKLFGNENPENPEEHQQLVANMSTVQVSGAENGIHLFIV